MPLLIQLSNNNSHSLNRINIKAMKIIKIFEKISTAFLPMLGMILQLYYIITAYTSYSSVTEITQLRENFFKPPVLVLCVPFMTSIQNWKKGSKNNFLEKFPRCNYLVRTYKCNK